MLYFKGKRAWKTCLNCRYEPDWEDTGNNYDNGYCKYVVKFPAIPKTWQCQEDVVRKWNDNSGIHINCPSWKYKLWVGNERIISY